MADYEVIVVGAGPVGLCLAIDLGRRGIKTLLLEKDPTTAPWPKMDRCNARTMEMFRRIGIADDIRALGYPADNPMNVILMRTLAEPALDTLIYPSVAEFRARIAQCKNSSESLEPYQLVSQNAVEPYLKSVAEQTANVTVRYGCALERFEHDAAGVIAFCQTTQGSDISFTAQYLVGCDGGRSIVRKALGIELRGQGGLLQMVQCIFQSEDLYAKIQSGKGRFYCYPQGGSITAQGSRKEFTFHSMMPEDTDFDAEIRKRIGFDCDVRVKHVLGWKHHLLLADSYRHGRVLLAGDAVHLIIPNGGLGMNTGVGDAFDLSWKLAGTLQGWGGPRLLDAYQAERRPVAAKNIEASRWASSTVPLWLQQYRPHIYDDTPEGHTAKRRLIEAYREYHVRVFSMIGVEIGYSYAWSDIVADEPGNVPEWSITHYDGHTRPGVKLPHIWLKDGRAMQDVLGQNYTVLDLRGDADTGALEAAFTAMSAPFDLVRLDEPHVRAVYGKSLYVLRPDLHIAWRGDALPDDASQLAQRITGY